MFLNFDIGGTFIKFAVIENIKKAQFLKAEKVKTTTKPMERITEIIQKTLPKVKVNNIGISVAANVSKTGKIINSTNLNFKENFHIKNSIENKFNINCEVINDGNATALGCSALTEFKNNKNFVSVTLGTGIGGGLILNGKLHTTSTGFESEIGHIVVEENGHKCNCGKYGCVEAYCGSNGIVKRFNSINSLKTVKNPVEINKLLIEGDLNARKVVFETGLYLGKALSIISDIINPELFILNGGTAKFGEQLIEGIINILKQRCFSRVKQKYPEVRINKFENPALIGTMLLFN